MTATRTLTRVGARAPIALAGALLALALAASPAAADSATFSGGCQFAGPIFPGRPITIFPVPGAHFSYTGAGVCNGKLDASKIAAAPITVTFTNVSTLFDTCELGPDFNLHGLATISAGGRVDSFAITVDLARLALVGPFLLTTPGGGLAIGLAQFTPANLAGALTQCVSPGVATASLSARFNTARPLVGVRG
jgi:hypothetical protein